MAWKTGKVEIEGLSFLLMHNGLLADPLNEITRSMKKITSKHHSKVTDDDRWELRRLEFLGSMYVNDDGAPCIPAENIEAMIRDAAKSVRKGKAISMGVVVPEAPAIIYDGPKDPDAMWEERKWHDCRLVCVNNGRVIRTRPRFKSWKLKFEVEYLSGVIGGKPLLEIIEYGGGCVGLGDYRPKFGRFSVTKSSGF